MNAMHIIVTIIIPECTRLDFKMKEGEILKIQYFFFFRNCFESTYE